jgi:peptidoglycan/LPS O-acetylase OafA/YrhL
MTATENTHLITTPSKTSRLAVVDSLRGVAALSVVWCHLAGFGVFAASARYGWLGVYIFFVVSGFILPYTLFQADYKISSYGKFLLKRICRIDPPYFLSIALEIGFVYLASLSPMFKVGAPSFTWKQILMHVGYLNAFTGGPWIIGVFWTLGIEFQYYLLIGILFPVFASKSRLLESIVFLPLLIILLEHHEFALRPRGEQGGLIFPYAFVFLMGIFTFKYRSGLTGRRAYLVSLLLVSLCAAACQGPIIALTALSTALLIAFAHFRSRILEWVGMISYSLYLIPLLSGYKLNRFNWLELSSRSSWESEGWRACKMGVFSKSVTLKICRIW